MSWNVRRYVSKERFEELKNKLKKFEIFESKKYLKIHTGKIEYVMMK